MNRPRINSGPVAFFDILGYKDINNNNEIRIVADLIVDYVDKTPAHLREFIIERFSSMGLTAQVLDGLASRTSRLLISDSVLLTAAQPERRFNLQVRIWEWLLFVLECRELMGWMFENGLPLKGAIGYGEYFRKGNCFAGKSILDAFRLVHNLEVAGLAFVPNAWNEVEVALSEGARQIDEFFRSISFKYEVPLKAGCSGSSLLEKQKSLTMIAFDLPAGCKGNVREKSQKAFTAHKKEIKGQVEKLFDNTVLMMEKGFR